MPQANIPSEEEVLGYFDKLSNWGRWGQDEVVQPAAPVAEELGHGLAALSVAHQLYAAEALALGSDAGLAETYLSMQGFQVAS